MQQSETDSETKWLCQFYLLLMRWVVDWVSIILAAAIEKKYMRFIAKNVQVLLQVLLQVMLQVMLQYNSMNK